MSCNIDYDNLQTIKRTYICIIPFLTHFPELTDLPWGKCKLVVLLPF